MGEHNDLMSSAQMGRQSTFLHLNDVCFATSPMSSRSSRNVHRPVDINIYIYIY